MQQLLAVRAGKREVRATGLLTAYSRGVRRARVEAERAVVGTRRGHGQAEEEVGRFHHVSNARHAVATRAHSACVALQLTVRAVCPRCAFAQHGGPRRGPGGSHGVVEATARRGVQAPRDCRRASQALYPHATAAAARCRCRGLVVGADLRCPHRWPALHRIKDAQIKSRLNNGNDRTDQPGDNSRAIRLVVHPARLLSLWCCLHSDCEHACRVNLLSVLPQRCQARACHRTGRGAKSQIARASLVNAVLPVGRCKQAHWRSRAWHTAADIRYVRPPLWVVPACAGIRSWGGTLLCRIAAT